MVCYLSCSLAAAFIIVSAVMMFMPAKGQQQLMKLLSLSQKQYYYEVVKNRLNVYWLGTLIGLALGLVVVVWVIPTQPLLQKVCYFLVTLFATQVIVYSLMPKKYILEVLTSQDQVKAWLQTYRSSQLWFWSAFLVGALGYGLLVYGLNKFNK